MEGGTDIALEVSKKPMAFDMGIICTGIAGILPVFKKTLQTHTPTHTQTHIHIALCRQISPLLPPPTLLQTHNHTHHHHYHQHHQHHHHYYHHHPTTTTNIPITTKITTTSVSQPVSVDIGSYSQKSFIILYKKCLSPTTHCV